MRYDISCRLLWVRVADSYISGDLGDLGEVGDWWEEGTATGFDASWLCSCLPWRTSTAFEGVGEPVAGELDELLCEGPIREWNDLGRLLFVGGWTAVPWACVSEGSGGAATRWF